MGTSVFETFCVCLSANFLFFIQYSTGQLNTLQYNTIHYNTIHYNTKYSTFLLKYSTFYMVDSKTEGVCSERTQRTILRSFSYNTLQYKILNLFAKILNLLQIIVTVTGHRSRSGQVRSGQVRSYQVR